MKTLEVHLAPGKIKGVVFDFDGTLAVLNIDFSSMKEEVFDLIRQFGVREESIKERYLLEIIEEVYQLLWQRNPGDADAFYQGAHRVLHTIEMKAAEEGRLMPSAKAALEFLRKNGMKIGIVTRNCEAAVRKVFPQVDEFCDVFISRNSVRNVKPHPDHLASVMKALGLSGEETVMVGDHTIDVQAGKGAGMKTIGVLTGRTRREEFEQAGADYVLSEAAEICRLLVK
jgi:phosphoglycolate phosphatase